jgi:hypothetical protein
LHEWASSKGKEKKPPEQIDYWNAKLSSETEAETDWYPFTLPCLDFMTQTALQQRE